MFFKSNNISRATFREGAWVKDITKNCGPYREIPPFAPELFFYSHMSNGSLLSGKTKSSGKGIEEIYFRRNRMDRQFWRFDNSPVDLKFCGIRIMNVKCLNCLIWLKEFSRIRGKFQNVISQIYQTVTFAKVYLAVIFGLHFGMHLLSRSVFARMIFLFTLFTIYFLFPNCFWKQSWCYRYPPLSYKFNFLWSGWIAISWVLFCNFAVSAPFSTSMEFNSMVQDKSVLNKEQERDSCPSSLFSTDLFCTKRGYSKVTK